MPRPNAGYWVERKSLDHVNDVYKCPRSTCVLSESQTTTNRRHLSGDVDSSTCWDIAVYRVGGDDNSLCNSDKLLCKEGSRGTLCGSCDDTFFFSSAERVCLSCSASYERNVVFFTTTGVITLLLGCLFILSRYMFVIPSCVERSWVCGLLRQVDSGDLRVAWANYQIIQSVAWNLDLQWPSPFKEMLTYLSFFSFDLFSLECFFEHSDYFLTVYIWSTAPLIFAALLVLGHKLRSTFSRTVGESETLTFRLLLLCYLVLPPVTLKQLQAFDCVNIAGGDYLRIDTSVDCHSREFQSFTTVNGFFLALYLATPLLWFLLLFRQRKKLNPLITACGDDYNAHPQEALERTLTARDGDASLRPLRFLFSSYQPTYYHIECLEMYRRVLFVGVLPLLSARPDRRSALGIFFSLCSLAFYGEVAPFLRPTTNSLAYVAQYATLLTFGAALAIEVGLDKGVNSFLFGSTLVAVNVVVVSLIFRASVLKYLRERSMQQWRRALTPQELLIVNRIMRRDPMQGSSLEEIELVERGGNGDKGADIENRCEQALNQTLLDPNQIKLTKRVGAGSFGEVFKGTLMGQPVAVKTLINITDDNVRVFRNEILLTASLRHPNVVAFVGSVLGVDLIGLVLEWIPRGTLSALLENKSQDLPWEDPLLRLAMDVARGMAYLHGREYFDELDGEHKSCILHRDLKPDNALVSDYTSVKITDFGSARAKAADDVLMTSLGTPLFCAPEIIQGDPYDEKADVYSFGMTLIAMASDEIITSFLGERWKTKFAKEVFPNPGSISYTKVLRPIWEGKWQAVSEQDPIEYAPPSINKLITLCCSYESETRPTFTEILNELAGACSVEIERTVFFRHPRDSRVGQRPGAQSAGVFERRKCS